MSETLQPVSNTKTHQRSTLALLILAIILLFAILIIVALLLWYAKETQRRLALQDIRIDPGIYKLFQPQQICDILVTTCASPNHSSNYGRVLFPSLGNFNPNGSDIQKETILIGARPLNYGNAMVVLGLIPRNKVYWAWTGYLWTIPWYGEGARDGRLNLASTIGDSIDSGNTFSRSEDDYLAVVFTPNPNFVSVVKEQFLARIPSPANIQWKEMIIPSEMYSVDYDYCLFSRFLQTQDNETGPAWQCWFFQATSNNVYSQPTLPVLNPIKIRSTLPNEYELKEILEEPNIELWYQEGENFIKRLATEHNINLPHNWNQYSRKTVPFWSWVEGMCNNPDRCGLLCGCQGLQFKLNLRFDNNSTIYYVNKGSDKLLPNAEEGIKVLPGQKLVVYCLDHVASTAVVAYSNITFTDIRNETSFDAYISGIVDPLVGPPSLPTKKIRIFFNELKPELRDAKGIGSILITERAYVNRNGTGPWYSAILPMQVFLLGKDFPLPTEATSVGYPYPV